MSLSDNLRRLARERVPTAPAKWLGPISPTVYMSTPRDNMNRCEIRMLQVFVDPADCAQRLQYPLPRVKHEVVNDQLPVGFFSLGRPPDALGNLSSPVGVVRSCPPAIHESALARSIHPAQIAQW